MRKAAANIAFAALTLSFPTNSFAESGGRSAAAEPQLLAVRIYNYAEASPKTLKRALEVAQSIYRKAGIETIWVDCPVVEVETLPHPACDPRPNPSVLQLRILPERMSQRFDVDPNVFGFALPSPRNGFGLVASIFFHRIESLAKSTRLSTSVILGHMLAHEAGHLLLGMGGHSSKGIMHIPWLGDELKRAGTGQLRFTRKQAQKMAVQVRSRSAAQRSKVSSD